MWLWQKNSPAETSAVMERDDKSAASTISRRIPRKPVPQPEEARPDLAAYFELAEQLDFAPQDVVTELLCHVMAKLDIPTFDHGDVARYLQHQCQKAGYKRWCWRPLRPKDVIKHFMWGESEKRSDYYCSDLVQCHPYHRQVPIETLRRVAAIEEKMGKYPIAFFVSDWEQKNLDPFIMVTYAGKAYSPESQFVIFDFWDEPAFARDLGSLLSDQPPAVDR